MKLPIPSFGKKEKKEHFLVVLLRDEKISAVILEETKGIVKIIGKHDQHLSDSLENATSESWIETFDKAISTAEASSHITSVDTYKTLFGVKENWVDDGKIKKEFLVNLKKVSDSLSLEPIGFLVLIEAISHFLHKHEGAPISAIFVEIGQKNLTASLVKAGKIIETKTSQIEESAVKTTDTLLKHFESAQVLPSRIILSQEDKDEKLAQEFIAHSWSKSLPFLHMPQITNLPESFDVKAVVFGATTQMGFELLPDSSHLEETSEPEVITKTMKEEPGEDEDLGFYEDTDVALRKPEKKSHVEEEIKIEKENEKSDQTIKIHGRNSDESVDSYYSDDLKEPTTEQHISKKSSFNLLGSIGQIFSKIPALIPMNKFSNSFKGKFMVIPPLILVICIALFLIYTQMLQAEVTINVDAEVIDETQDITIAKDQESNFSEHIISGETISVEKEGSATTQATGKKETGDKAKGTVTLYSRINQSRTFPAGTTIKSSNNIEFTFDKEVSVASSSADASASPSTAKVAVTAVEIGKEANLPSGTKFTLGTLSAEDLVAKNDSAMSGGSKKEITVVDRTDLETLDQKLPKDLREKAQADFSKKVGSDQVLLPIMLSQKLSKKDYDKKVGDEAKSVKLDATVTFESLAYNKQDLTNYAKELIKDRISEDQSAQDSGMEFDIEKTEVEDENIKGTLKIKAQLLPKMDQKKIQEAIAGKSFTNAKSILADLPQVSQTNLKLSPNLPFLPDILPQRAENIKIIVNNE